jgi:integrase
VVGAKWSEFDLEQRVWTIPAARAKNKLSHRVPLSHLALELIRRARFSGSPSPWVFPSRWDPEKQMDRQAPGKWIRRNLEQLGIEQFTAHDLRRTAASLMTGAGVPRLVVSKLLNHREGIGVTFLYDRHGYDAEKREALETWARRLEEIAAGGEEKENQA